MHRAERLVQAALAPDTVRCRVRADGIVIELDPAALGRMPGHPALEASLRTLAGGAVRFAAYRSGSAFLRP